MGFLNDLDLGNVEADPNYIPDGPYPANIVKSDIVTRKNDGKQSWVLTYQIIEGRFAGKQQQEWFDLKPEGDNAELKKSFLKRRVLSLGIPENEVSNVDTDYFVGMRVKVTIKHRNGYQNVSDVELMGTVTPTSSGSLTDGL